MAGLPCRLSTHQSSIRAPGLEHSSIVLVAGETV
jgi:hypothetical protein